MKEMIEKMEEGIGTLFGKAVKQATNATDAKLFAEAALTATKVYSIMLAVQQTRALNVPFNIKKETIDESTDKN